MTYTPSTEVRILRSPTAGLENQLGLIERPLYDGTGAVFGYAVRLLSNGKVFFVEAHEMEAV